MTGERLDRLSSRYRKVANNSSWLTHSSEKFFLLDGVDEDEFNTNDPSELDVKKKDAITQL